jgi:hypothetical protein
LKSRPLKTSHRCHIMDVDHQNAHVVNKEERH